MSRRKEWNLDLLSGQTAALVLLGAAFVLGSVAGCLMAGGMDSGGQGALREYLDGYLALMGQDSFAPRFWPMVWDVARFPLLAAVLGFTALGVVGLPMLFGIRGFLLSYAVSAFYRLYGLSGQVPAFLLFGLSALLWMPVLFHLGVQGLLCAYGLLRRSLGEGRYPLGIDRSYWVRCGVCTGVLCVCAAIEYLAVPVLFQAVAKLLY